ncbi:MAG: FtsW/RodA/SpoVE family cell cycle protein [Chloroflexota bacterium]
MSVLRLDPVRLRGLARGGVGRTWGTFDLQLTLYALALIVLGLLMAFTNSTGDPLAPGSLFVRGLMWLALASIVYIAVSLIDYRWFQHFSPVLYVGALGLLVLTLAVGSGVGGVSRWVTIGPLQFQFSEVAKVVMAIVLAAWIAARAEKLRSPVTIAGAFVLGGPVLALVLIQPDLGTSLVIGAITFGVLFVSGASLRWLGLVVAAIIAAFPIIWSQVLRDYQKQRLVAFLDPEADPLGSGYQLLQSQIAVGTGGVFGKGLMNGTTGQEYLPVQATDFVFARLGEELGLIGGVVALGFFALLLWRVILIGWRSPDLFGLAFAAGIGSMLLFQLLVNVGMVLGIMPITGIPLPFVTHGGASLVSIAIGLAVLQSITMRRGGPSA